MTGSTDTATEVIALLRAMNTAIRTAQFDKIETILAALEPKLNAPMPVNDMALKQIRTLAQSNSACLEAATQGLRAGRRRLAEISAAGRADTYDRHGMRHALPVEGAQRRF